MWLCAVRYVHKYLYKCNLINLFIIYIIAGDGDYLIIYFITNTFVCKF